MSNEENKETLTLADQERAAHIAHGLAENPEVLWHDTIFKDLQWYYVEGGMYAVRRLENHKCAFVALVEAKEPFDAVAKVRDGTEWVGQSQLRYIGNAAAMRDALVGLARAVRAFMATKGANFYPDIAIALEAANAALSSPTTEKSSAVGNTAAMREAQETILRY